MNVHEQSNHNVSWVCKFCDKTWNEDGKCCNLMGNVCPQCFWGGKYLCTRCREVYFKDKTEIWVHPEIRGNYCMECAEYYNDYYNLVMRSNTQVTKRRKSNEA